MNKSIFSTYSQNENRVTSTLLAVFERINTNTLTNILQGIMEDNNVQLTVFDNQVKTDKTNTVPDGEISSSFKYLIETKIKSETVDTAQIKGHLKLLEEAPYDDKRLIVITNDREKPDKLNELNDQNIIYWCNFDSIFDSISNIIENDRLISEREKYLLEELKIFITEEDLLSEDISNKILVVPASIAYQHYLDYKVYVCQPNRSFQPSTYMAFYSKNTLYKEVPKILATIEAFDLINGDIKDAKIEFKNGAKETDIKQRLADFTKIVRERNWKLTPENKITFLSRGEEEGTYIHKDIANDKLSSSGRRTAFVQGQRYIDLEKLKRANTTTDLE